ncbi:hypothetical protein Tco_1533965 [Tanacetum coccineum]
MDSSECSFILYNQLHLATCKYFHLMQITPEEGEYTTELQTLMEEFVDVFAVSFNQKDVIEAMVIELLESGVIKPSHSSLSYLIVLVKKKDGTWRMCIDCRQLNKNTIKDKFPILVINELIDELQGAKLFPKLDMRYV